jgi:hypothetical protein
MKRYIVERRNDIIDFKEREQGGLIFIGILEILF